MKINRLALLIFFVLAISSRAYPAPTNSRPSSTHYFTRGKTLCKAAVEVSDYQIAELSKKIEDMILEKKNPENLIQQLESLNHFDEPNRSPEFLGEWHVWYTDCPPPSNGQLGPFWGTAGQIIQDKATYSYQNLLKVPPSDWLTATLDGVWEDWDGQLLVEDPEPAEDGRKNHDWGANHWKVTFKNLRIALFGFTLVNKEFPPDTSRVWRTTFLDKEIRVVRAGKTGRVEDEVVFYTKRLPAPLELLK